MTENKKQRERRVRRSDSLRLSIYHEPREPPDIDNMLTKVLIDVARSLDIDGDPDEAEINQVSSAEEAPSGDQHSQ